MNCAGSRLLQSKFKTSGKVIAEKNYLTFLYGMERDEIPYRNSQKYPGKKTISLPEDVEKMWTELSKIHKVEIVEAVRPLVIEKVRAIYAKVVGS